MSIYRQEGKDKIIFATAEDHKEPSTVVLPEVESEYGLLLPNGEINWNCPCLGGMASGPCGIEFREAFSCFHHSEADPKGSDCSKSFREMQLCMAEYPDLYGKHDDDDDLDDDNDEINLDELEKSLVSDISKNKLDEKESSTSKLKEEKVITEKKSGISLESVKSKSSSTSDQLKLNVNT